MRAFRAASAAWAAGLALGLLGPGACVQQSEGHAQPVTLRLVGKLSPRVAAASLTIASIELEPCEEKRSAWARVWKSLPTPSLSTARAHTNSTALRIGVPKVVDLHGRAGKEQSLGAFHAPAGMYCRVLLELSPADEDADGLDGMDGGAGETLRVRFGDDSPDLNTSARRLGRVVLGPPVEVSGEPRAEPLHLRLDRAHWDEQSLESADTSLSRLAHAFEAS